MTTEAIDLHKPSAEQVVNYLKDLGPTRQWELVRKEFAKASDFYLRRRQILFLMADDTASASAHIVRAFMSPDTNSFVAEIPAKDENQSNTFPTVLHAIEVAATVVQLTKSQNLRLETPTYPSLTFTEPSNFDQLLSLAIEPEVVLIPLVVDPKTTVSLAFHPQARRLSPRSIAEGYYNLIKGWDLTVDLLRHTMLVLASSEYNRPRSKTQVFVNVLPTEDARRQFSLLNLGRIKMWETNEDPTEKYQIILR